MKILLTLFMLTASISLQAQEVLFKLNTIAFGVGSLNQDNHPVIKERTPIKFEVLFRQQYIEVVDGKNSVFYTKNKEIRSIGNSVMLRFDGTDNDKKECVVMLELYEDACMLNIYYPQNNFYMRYYFLSDETVKQLLKGS